MTTAAVELAMKPIRIAMDENGIWWFFDPAYQRIFCEGDGTSKDRRGYGCDSIEEAARMVHEGEVP